MRLPTLSLASTLLLLCTGSAHADVLIVRPDGAQGFADVQSAIDASAHGDTILVQTGTYPGFEILNRTVSVVADFNAEVLIVDTVTIRDLALGRTATLSGLIMMGLDREVFPNPQGPSLLQVTTDGLQLLNNVGPVRISQCSIQGGNVDSLAQNLATPNSHLDGAVAARVNACADVLFTNCTFSGGSGGSFPTVDGVSGNGAAGMTLESSLVTMWDCTLTGGSSTAGALGGGYGGNACENTGGNLTLVTSSLLGGTGGADLGFADFGGGAGGPALFTSAGGNSYLSGVTATAGSNGTDFGVPQPPVPVFGGQGLLEEDSEIERVLSAPRIAIEGAPVELDYRGKTGDSLRLLYGYGTNTLFREIFPLPILVAKPGRLTDNPIGMISTLSGGTTAFFDLPDLPAAMGARQIWIQGLVSSANGRSHLTSPVAVTIINCSTLQPDCNGNSRFDSCDIALGTSQDFQNDGVPDECEPDCNLNGVSDFYEIAEGTSFDCQGNNVPDECEADCNGDGVPDECEGDCNLNGIADPCDLASSQSVDQDGNGIPDECDGPIGTPVYVDGSVPFGGDGSAGSPFSSIKLALFNSDPGNSIVVADGIYTGSGNSSLITSGNRDIISANGPDNCIIDLEQLSRFMRVGTFLFPTAAVGPGRLRGFTIRNGRPFPATTLNESCLGTSALQVCGAAIAIEICTDFRIENCVFENNGSRMPGSITNRGGAIFAGQCEGLVIQNCWFEGNEADVGGAIQVVDGTEVTVEGCQFENNHARSGGAMILSGDDIHVIDSSFERNSAFRGGAMYLGAGRTVVEACHFRENSADFSGGGINVALGLTLNDTPLISHCLFLGNASVSGGALHFGNTVGAELLIDHCLLAGNRATNGGGLNLEADTRVTHCTLVENRADSIGGGLRSLNGSNLELRNSILWDNTAPIGPELYTFEAASLIARYCDIYDFPLTPIEGCGELWCSTNVSIDPLFVDADGPDNNPATLLGNDWRLSASSPLIDAGSNGIATPDLLDLDRDGDRTEPTPLDLQLRPRFIDLPNPDTGVGPGPLVDIGAFERQP